MTLKHIGARAYMKLLHSATKSYKIFLFVPRQAEITSSTQQITVDVATFNRPSIHTNKSQITIKVSKHGAYTSLCQNNWRRNAIK